MTNYQRGYVKERYVKAYLETKGYFVLRAGASKGPIDLIALIDQHPAMLLQVKSTQEETDSAKLINRPSFRKMLAEFELLAASYGYLIVAVVQVIKQQTLITFFHYDAGIYKRISL